MALPGVGDQEIVLVLVAVDAGEAVSKDAAFESRIRFRTHPSPIDWLQIYALR